MKKNLITKHQEYLIPEGKIASSLGIIVSYLFDLCIMFIIGIILCLFVYNPCFGYGKINLQVDEITSKMLSEGKDTKLYLINDDNDGYVDDETYFKAYLQDELNAYISATNYQNPLYFYYQNYGEEKKSIATINQEILDIDNNQFYQCESINDYARIVDIYLEAASNVINNENYTSADYALYSELETYFLNLIGNARDSFTNNQNYLYHQYYQEYCTLCDKLNHIAVKSSILSYFSVIIIYQIILPLFLKKKTIGQKIFKIAIVYQDNTPITFFDLITRCIMMIPLTFIICPLFNLPNYSLNGLLLPFITLKKTTITYLIPFIISFIINFIDLCIIIFTSRKQTYVERSFAYCLINEATKESKKHEKK